MKQRVFVYSKIKISSKKFGLYLTPVDGKGNLYVDVVNMHVPMRDAIQTDSKKSICKSIAVKNKKGILEKLVIKLPIKC